MKTREEIGSNNQELTARKGEFELELDQVIKI